MRDVRAGRRHFALHVAKDDLKFSAAHFIAYRGFREPLHGHNYHVAVTVEGDLGENGYVLDFRELKRAVAAICRELDERVLLPERSECLRIETRGESVEVRTEDGSRFVLPRADVRLLPIAHSSAEELSRYILERLRATLAAGPGCSLRAIEVRVREARNQSARCRSEL